MKELKILIIVVIFSLVTYYLVEPFAHSQMHKHVESNNFDYVAGSIKFAEENVATTKKSIEKLTEELASAKDEKEKKEFEKALKNAKESLITLEARLVSEKAVWKKIEKTSQLKGDVANGKELVMGAGACVGCHSIKVAGMDAPMDAVSAAAAYGVNPPDLSNAGVLYDAKFLNALIKNPAHALAVEHKFDESKGEMHPMVPFYGAGGDMNQEVADMVAYLQSIAVKQEALTPVMAFENACGRCHGVKYEKWTQIGVQKSFKKKQDELAFETQVLDYQDSLKAYMGKLPPDLSMYIRSRGEHYIKTFVENPQNYLAGTAMPRVGITAETADKVIEYLEDSGDTKRHERDSLGVYVLIYSLIFAIFALLWKKQVWKDLH